MPRIDDLPPPPNASGLNIDDLPPPPVDQSKGSGQAALEHMGNAATFGYLPQLQAAAEPVMAKVGDLLTGNQVADTLPSYVGRRDENIARVKDEGEKHPIASGLGTAAGMIGVGSALSPLTAANAATWGGRALQAGRTGAAIGALANPGDQEGVVDPLQIGDRAKNAAINGLASTALQPAAEGVSKGIDWAGGKVGDMGKKAAARAMGASLRDVRRNDLDGMRAIGQEALDQGVIGWKPKGWERLSGDAATARDRVGQEIDNLITNLSQSQTAQNIPGIPRASVAQALRNRLIKPTNGNPTIRAQNDQLEKLIQEFESSGVPQLSLPSVRESKAGASDQINWKRAPNEDVPLPEQFNRGLYGEMKSAEEGAAQQIGKATGGGQDEKFRELKDSYGNLSEAAKMTKDRAAKETANRFLGLTDYIGGATGAGVGAYVGDKLGGHEGAKTGAEIGGFFGAMGNKAGRTYGNQVVAKSASALGNLLQKAPALQALYNKSPALVSGLLQDRLQGQPQEQPPLPPAFEQFRNNPAKIDSLPEGPLKAALMKRFNRSPSEAPTTDHTDPKNLISPDEARQMFREGN